jgi:hypothetical protein
MMDWWKFLVRVSFVAAIALFATYQLYCAWTYGVIYAGPPGWASYRSFASDPLWFALGLSVYLVGAVGCSVLTYLEVTSEMTTRSFWRKRISAPPVDNAVRRPMDS